MYGICMTMVQFLFSLILFLPILSFAQTCPNYTVCQNFEGNATCSDFLCLPGVDNGESWSLSNPLTGSVADANYSTSPLHGTQSLKLSTIGATCIEDSPCSLLLTKNITTTNFKEAYFFFRIKFTQFPQHSGYKSFFNLYDAFDTDFAIYVNNSGNLEICHGSTCQVSSSYILPGVQYYIWGYYGINNGVSDGSAWIKVGQTSTIPSSNFISINGNGTGYTPISMHFMLLDDNYEYFVDQILYRSRPIGSICQ